MHNNNLFEDVRKAELLQEFKNLHKAYYHRDLTTEEVNIYSKMSIEGLEKEVHILKYRNVPDLSEMY